MAVSEAAPGPVPFPLFPPLEVVAAPSGLSFAGISARHVALHGGLSMEGGQGALACWLQGGLVPVPSCVSQEGFCLKGPGRCSGARVITQEPFSGDRR